MKVLILSCKTGGGHDAAGFAVKEALEQKDMKQFCWIILP